MDSPLDGLARLRDGRSAHAHDARHRLAGRCDTVNGVKVTTKDGQVFASFCTPRQALGLGSMSLDDVAKKFYKLAEFSGICPAERADAIRTGVMELEQTEDAAGFVRDSLVLL